ncbi:DNA internalization-related competence protein ComEC/Rec2 [Jeotgalibacillus proteolyticus]|nr:DNA internalization-related competence protein ComEC/Rec2 [Jeotgalibacillus proteolyticus]
MKWIVPGALMALLGAAFAHSLIWGLIFLPYYLFSFIRHRPPLKILLPLILFAVFFYIYGCCTFNSQVTNLNGDEKTLPLKIVTPLKINDKTASAQAETVNGEKIQVRFYLPKDTPQEQISSITPSNCTWKGELEAPSPARNPYLFDYQHYLQNLSIHWIFTVSSIHDFSDCVPLSLTTIEKLLLKRDHGMNRVERIFPVSLQPVAKSLLFGDRSDMDEELLEAYRRLGVIHLLAISGMHVGMVVAMLWQLLLRVGVTKENVRFSLLAALPLYAAMTGGSPPVVRAVSSIIAVIFFTMVSKKITLLQALCITFIIQLLINPAVLSQVSFQLSYTVSFSIILSAPGFLKASSKLFAILKVTTVAQVGSLPILLFHFHETSIAGFFTNLFYIPLFTIVLLPSLFILYFLSFFNQELTYFLSLGLEAGVSLLNKVSLYLSSFPYVVLVFGKPSYFLVMVYIGLSLLLFFFLEKRIFVKPALLLLIALTVDWLSGRYSLQGSILFIDVGQGDSILIDLPLGQGTYLIDTGGAISFGDEQNSFSVGKEIIWPVLKGRGTTSIDRLILTHGDWDHIGGTVDLAAYADIKEVWISPGSYEKETVSDMLTELHELSIPVFEVQAPYMWTAGESLFELMYPHDEEYTGNNDSLVVKAEIGGLEWLFTGDLEAEGEAELMERYPSLSADVLKIGHHGSKTSTTEAFLDQVDPDYAIISAGAKNRYNHPHSDVVSRIEDKEIVLFGTYSHGAIDYQFQGKKGTFRTIFPYDGE